MLFSPSPPVGQLLRSPTTADTDNNSQFICIYHVSGVRFSCEASIMPCAVKA